MSEQTYCYVAEDPDQPGAAWAACGDDPRFAKHTAKSIAQWVREGAHVERVTTERAREMLKAWVHPDHATPDLFTTSVKADNERWLPLPPKPEEA